MLPTSCSSSSSNGSSGRDNGGGSGSSKSWFGAAKESENENDKYATTWKLPGSSSFLSELKRKLLDATADIADIADIADDTTTASTSSSTSPSVAAAAAAKAPVNVQSPAQQELVAASLQRVKERGSKRKLAEDTKADETVESKFSSIVDELQKQAKDMFSSNTSTATRTTTTTTAGTKDLLAESKRRTEELRKKFAFSPRSTRSRADDVGKQQLKHQKPKEGLKCNSIVDDLQKQAQEKYGKK